MSDLIKEYWLWKGKKAQVNINGLIVDVQILDFRQVWDRLDAKITPCAGTGEAWIEARRLIQANTM
jgi:hypothetical protein